MGIYLLIKLGIRSRNPTCPRNTSEKHETRKNPGIFELKVKRFEENHEMYIPPTSQTFQIVGI